MRVKRADERHVGGIEPDNAVVAFVDVAVPDYRRGEDQVARLHLATAAVDDGHRIFRAGGEAVCSAGVTVLDGALARIEHGQSVEHCDRGSGFRTESTMLH